jgi:hypothetical protein
MVNLYVVKFVLPQQGVTRKHYVAAKDIQGVLDKFAKDFVEPKIVSIKLVSTVTVLADN